MPDLVDELLAREDVVAGEPLDSVAVEEAISRVEGRIPDLLLKLWRTAGGVHLDSIDAELLGVEAALEMAPYMSPKELGFLPLLDTHQSNYVGVMVREPLAPRVGYMPHDDGPEGLMLRYRDVDGFLKALTTALDRGENADLFFHEDEGDYPLTGPRTDADRESALKLLATDGAHREWNWAIGLLEATDVPEWKRLLETPREIRCDVLFRLRQMNEPAIKELLAEDERAVEEFALALADAGKAAGYKAAQRNDSTLEGVRKWCDVDCFFSKRQRPDAARQVVAWFMKKDESIFR
jgi:hypothetical protein